MMSECRAVAQAQAQAPEMKRLELGLTWLVKMFPTARRCDDGVGTIISGWTTPPPCFAYILPAD